jgi:uncharacterized tellurite resistance protein B-like protein
VSFSNFFSLYMREREVGTLQRGGVEFRYASAALLIACANADLNESEDEQEAIRNLLQKTFKIPDRTLEKLFDFAYQANETYYLERITQLIDEHYPSGDKQYVIESLWRVANADGVIDEEEVNFIARAAAAIGLSASDVETARRKILG